MKIFYNNTLVPTSTKLFDRFFALTCGEEGRGRRLGFVPLTRDWQSEAIKLNGNYDVTKTQKGNWLIVPGNSRGIILVTNWYDGFRGSLSHNIDNLLEEGKVEILAKGATAEGDAGRMGGEEQFILKITQNCQLRYHKQGRVYGEPRDWVVDINVDNSTVEEYPAEAEIDLGDE